jgi:DNA-binding FadR family transcriptional regulator
LQLRRCPFSGKSLSETIAEKLEQIILENAFKVGGRLPSEEKLAECVRL